MWKYQNRNAMPNIISATEIVRDLISDTFIFKTKIHTRIREMRKIV